MPVDVMDPNAVWSGILSLYLAQRNQIQELQAQTEPGASGRKALNDLVDSNAETAGQAREIIKHIQNEDDEAKAVLVQVLLSEGVSIFRGIQKQFIDAHTNELEELSPEQKAQIEKDIEKAANAAKGLYQALDGFIDDEEAFATIPKLPRKKSAGGRGKRIKGVWNFSITGTNGATEKHVGKKAADLGGFVDMKLAEISAKMEANSLDPSSLPEYWTLDLNGRKVEAFKNVEIEDTPEGETDPEEVESEEEADNEV